MAWTFSKRCAGALRDGKIKVTIPTSVRVRILELIRRLSDPFWRETPEGDWYNTLLVRLTQKIKAETGLKELLAFPKNGEGPAKPGDLEAFILRGNYPPFLFDALELFYDSLGNERLEFQRTFNQIMEESNLGWRMAEGRIFPVDSVYIEEEICQRTHELLKEVKFQGASEEFLKAREDLANGNCEGAIQNANLAVESTIKQILNLPKAKPGELYQKLIEVNLVPEYYTGFLKSFGENILRAVAIIRNEEPGAGHGRGPVLKKIPKSLAELAVNLAAVLINYLIKRYLEQKSEKSPENDNGIPF